MAPKAMNGRKRINGIERVRIRPQNPIENCPSSGKEHHSSNKFERRQRVARVRLRSRGGRERSIEVLRRSDPVADALARRFM
jgi:hypothetical protein